MRFGIFLSFLYAIHGNMISVATLLPQHNVCMLRHPHYLNVFPQRQYCQSSNYTLGIDRMTLPATDLVTGRALTVHLAQWHTHQEGVIYERAAYISNLYHGNLSAGSPFDKRWAQLQYTVAISSAPGTDAIVSISRIDYMADTEGASDRYPDLGDTTGLWRYIDCSRNVDDPLTGRTYAYWNTIRMKPACDCQLYYARDPHTLRCVPGCTNTGPEDGQGYCLSQCSTIMGTGTPRHAYTFYPKTTAYIARDTCQAVCHIGYKSYGGSCRTEHEIDTTESHQYLVSSLFFLSLFVILPLIAVILYAAWSSRRPVMRTPTTLQPPLLPTKQIAPRPIRPSKTQAYTLVPTSRNELSMD